MGIAYGQPSGNSDTVILNKKDALKILAKAYEAKALEAQRDILLMQVDTLKARISIKDMMISAQSGQISDYKNIVASKSSIIQITEDQKKILEKAVSDANKRYRKEVRKKTLFQITTFLSIGAGVALYFLK